MSAYNQNKIIETFYILFFLNEVFQISWTFYTYSTAQSY